MITRTTKNNFTLLLEAGLPIEDAIEFAVEAAEIFDRNRKVFGRQGGPIGTSGRSIYRALCHNSHYEPDPKAFLDFRPFSGECLAEQLTRGRNSVAAAVRRLVDHGFIERRREGRGFLMRLQVPTSALIEYCEHFASIEDRQESDFYDRFGTYAAKILKLCPDTPTNESS